MLLFNRIQLTVFIAVAGLLSIQGRPLNTYLLTFNINVNYVRPKMCNLIVIKQDDDQFPEEW